MRLRTSTITLQGDLRGWWSMETKWHSQAWHLPAEGHGSLEMYGHTGTRPQPPHPAPKCYTGKSGEGGSARDWAQPVYGCALGLPKGLQISLRAAKCRVSLPQKSQALIHAAVPWCEHESCLPSRKWPRSWQLEAEYLGVCGHEPCLAKIFPHSPR